MTNDRLTRKRGSGNIVAMAIALMAIFAFSFVVADVLKVIAAKATVSMIAQKAGQFARTGRSGVQDTTTGLVTREATIRKLVGDLAGKFTVKNVVVSFENAAGGTTAGVADEFVKIKISGEVSLTPASSLLKSWVGDHSGTYTITSEAVVLNEKF